MTNENILDAIGGINENAVQDAKAYKRPKSKRWFRWGAMAACLCLVVGIAIPILHHKGGIDHQDPLQDTAAFELNGKFYEVVETPEVLEKYGLPSKITEDVAGDHVAYLKSDGDDSYECTPIETDMELYQYAEHGSYEVYCPALPLHRYPNRRSVRTPLGTPSTGQRYSGGQRNHAAYSSTAKHGNENEGDYYRT